MSTIKLKGSSSGEAEVTVAAAAGTPTFTLPTTVGSANQLLKNSGTAGTLEYSNNLTFDGNNLDVSGGCITTFGGNSTNEGACIKVGYEGSSKGQVRVYGADASTTGSLEFKVCESDGSDDHTVTVQSSGNLEIGDGDLVIGTAGHGIDFSATSDATGKTSELLDDYEEGLYAVTMTPASGSVSLKGGANEMTYTKIGRQVTVSGRIDVNSVSSPSGELHINLPFTAGDVADISNASAASLFVYGAASGSGIAGQWVGWADNNQNTLQFRQGSANAPPQSGNLVIANTEFRISFTYFTA